MNVGDFHLLLVLSYWFELWLTASCCHYFITMSGLGRGVVRSQSKLNMEHVYTYFKY
jgi:hypothetical protein